MSGCDAATELGVNQRVCGASQGRRVGKGHFFARRRRGHGAHVVVVCGRVLCCAPGYVKTV